MEFLKGNWNVGNCWINGEANHRTNRGSVSRNVAEGGQRSRDAKVLKTSKSSTFLQNPADFRIFLPFHKAFFVRRPFIHFSQGLKDFEIFPDVPEIQLSYFRPPSPII
jgi:hypothetical protein